MTLFPESLAQIKYRTQDLELTLFGFLRVKKYLRNIPDGSSLYDVPDDKLPDSLILGAGLKIVSN